ncbi:MAG: class I SAM-dependent methyltransferase [Clostridium sp.]|nr:class I SAM-dependent methyltransferase [Clostridium sp.]
MNHWDKIWKNRETKLANTDDVFQMFCNLKKANGFDTQDVDNYFESFYEEWLERTRFIKELCKKPLTSVYEVGCGSGVNLYMFRQLENIQRLGGIDYSENIIKAAKTVVDSADLLCGEALSVSVEEKYDLVLADSVFQYFQDAEYGMQVLDRMYQKADKMVVITEIHDESRKEEHLEYRRASVENYDEKYKGLDKTFYTKEMFQNFAEKAKCKCVIKKPQNEIYWNNQFVFDCYLCKDN